MPSLSTLNLARSLLLKIQIFVFEFKFIWIKNCYYTFALVRHKIDMADRTKYKFCNYILRSHLFEYNCD